MGAEQANIFYWSNGLPFHLSVGAVVVNDKNEVLVHHYPVGTAAEPETYLLMRESIHIDERPLDAVHRGISEEFGLKAEVQEFIGSIVCEFIHENGVKVEKTTLYFLCDQPVELPEGRHGDDLEATSTLEWHDPIELMKLSRAQAEKIGRSDFDESKILERVAAILARKS